MQYTGKTSKPYQLPAPSRPAPSRPAPSRPVSSRFFSPHTTRACAANYHRNRNPKSASESESTSTLFCRRDRNRRWIRKSFLIEKSILSNRNRVDYTLNQISKIDDKQPSKQTNVENTYLTFWPNRRPKNRSINEIRSLKFENRKSKIKNGKSENYRKRPPPPRTGRRFRWRTWRRGLLLGPASWVRQRARWVVGCRIPYDITDSVTKNNNNTRWVAR